jgi:biopolymer transport protein ExbD
MRFRIPETSVEQPPMSPFIDVVFQLLIFFMLTLQMSDVKTEQVRLPQSKDPDRTKAPDALVLNVRKDGAVVLSGKVVSDSALDREFIVRRANPKHQEARGNASLVTYPVLIRADGSAPFEVLQKIMMAASRNGGVTRILFCAAPEGGRGPNSLQ